MKKIKKLPTILGILILISGLVAGIFLVNSRQVFKLGASADFAPKNVRVSNITNSSLTITWTTDKISKGFIKWGKSESALSKTTLEENAEKEFIHSVNLPAIEPNTDVFFKINSEGEDFDNSGIPWQSKTLLEKTNQTSSLTGSGIILSPDGSSPAKAIVYLSVNGIALSNLTSQEGTWIIPISLFIESIPETTVIEISVIDGQGGTAQAAIYPTTIKNTPTIVIGKTYDFRNYVPTVDSNLPESKLTIPETIEISSRFEVDNSSLTLSSNNVVTLDSIDEGEIITTTDPQFFGTAPAKTGIEISVESELQTDSLTSSSTGKWSWSPPTNLDPGQHTVTIKWRDSNGILRTLTRNFVVQAGEAPAFEATPSATPNITATPTSRGIATPITSPTGTSRSTSIPTTIPSTTPTIKASGTPKATISATPTNPSLPESGNLTPTIGLFIMGVGILMSSIFVWKRQDA